MPDASAPSRTSENVLESAPSKANVAPEGVDVKTVDLKKGDWVYNTERGNIGQVLDQDGENYIGENNENVNMGEGQGEAKAPNGQGVKKAFNLIDIHNQIKSGKQELLNMPVVPSVKKSIARAHLGNGWQMGQAAKRFLAKENPQDIIGIDKVIPKDGIYNREFADVMLGKFEGGGVMPHTAHRQWPMD